MICPVFRETRMWGQVWINDHIFGRLLDPQEDWICSDLDPTDFGDQPVLLHGTIQIQNTYYKYTQEHRFKYISGKKNFNILRSQQFCLFSNTLSIAVAEWATVAYKWISYSDGFPDSRDLTKVIEIAQRLRRWDHPFKCVFSATSRDLNMMKVK